MGMFDTVELLEPVPCFACYSTVQDETGKNYFEGGLEVNGKKPVRIIIPHDGKGGIKNFQTKDIGEPSITTYKFPGFIPLLDDYRGQTITLSKICNACETSWEGKLFVGYDKEDNIFLMNAIEIWEREHETPQIFNLYNNSEVERTLMREQDIEIYKIQHFSDKRIRIVPNNDLAIEVYNRKALRFKSKAEVARSFIESLKDRRKSTEKIISCLEELLSESIIKSDYTNNLARAITDYNMNKETLILTEGALKAAIVILYRENKEAALHLLDMSGIQSEQEFLRDLWTHEWFFLNEKDLTSKQKGGRMVGMFGGANYFLESLYAL